MSRRVAVATALVVLTLLVGSRWVTNRSAVLANQRSTIAASPPAARPTTTAPSPSAPASDTPPDVVVAPKP